MAAIRPEWVAGIAGIRSYLILRDIRVIYLYLKRKALWFVTDDEYRPYREILPLYNAMEIHRGLTVLQCLAQSY